MNKYINIFHSNNNKECYIVNGAMPSETKKLDPGDKIMISLEGKDAKEAVLGYDSSKLEFYIDVNGKHIYDIQGMKVL